MRHRGASAGPSRERAALPTAGQVRAGAGAEAAASGRQRPREEEDARTERRVRPAAERHPEPGEREEVVQI